ncbi:MAG: alpha-L-rhamnosidase C-terminal domain-containing protein, partial [Spirochaetales bacterium]|nr:alpha-L-rhamnosidase C-terminal domain-containing protein [Spirochaetales bacterium]
FNHYAYGSVGAWMYSDLAGINTDEDAPGYKRILFAPKPGGGIDSAEAEILTPYGKASISWEIRNDEFSCTVEVPVNAQAALILPGDGSQKNLGSGSHSFKQSLI